MSLVATSAGGFGPCPIARAASLLSLRRWQGRWILLIVLLVPAWLLDRPIAERSPRKHNIGLIEDFRDAGRLFGEPFCAFWLALAIWMIDPSRRRPVVLTIVGVMFAGLVSTSVKLAVGRERPIVSDCRTVLRGPQWPGAMRPDPSFPSGHTVSAFALAYGLSRLFPRGLPAFLFFASVCGVTRCLGETHFLTDVVAGAWIGWESARMVWECGLWKLIRWIDSKIPAFRWYPHWNWDRPASV
jgi:membrane-associated phospholipid phosphatase